MDAWVEEYFLNHFHSVAQNKSCIMITHRLTTALYANRIDFLENGSIVESGNHQDLLTLGGCYAMLWHSQTMPKQSTDRD
jgi:ABC-type transport system involved in Fe-S cluster assembly fused permease/ATPase subunit